MTPLLLKQFLTVCRRRSISGAAEELNIAQPALSKRMAQIERELKATLFVRHSRGVDLTLSGEKLRQEAAEIVHRLESLTSRIEDEKELVSGKVTVVVISSLASALALQLYPMVEQLYPKVQLRIIDGFSDQAVKAMHDRTAELGIIPNAAADLPIAASIPLFEEPFVFVQKKGQNNIGRTITLQEAIEYPLVLPFHGHDLRRRVDEAARNAGITVDPKFESGSIQVIGDLVENGLACSIMPKCFWLAMSRTREIQTHLIHKPSFSRMHSLCWMPDQNSVPAVIAVRKVIQQEIKSMVESGRLSGTLASHMLLS
ncbi:MAG: LysR family transcriptional regulator [Cognatishimia sp.]